MAAYHYILLPPRGGKTEMGVKPGGSDPVVAVGHR
ncbi:hypothetical protein BMS3Abin14_01280 [bacterium BMS3Abin14]|nr:hypothetical protein BMS3Abin14_01280 [bacterium BMS3Abin14]